MRFSWLLLALVLFIVARPAPAAAYWQLPPGGLVGTRAVAGASGPASTDGTGRWSWIIDSPRTPWARRLEGATHPDVSSDGATLLFAAPGEWYGETFNDILEMGLSTGGPASWLGAWVWEGRLDGDAHEPVWSPTRHAIAFTYTPRSAPGRSQIMVLRSELHQLTWATRNAAPAFSPDGTQIAYTAYPANAAGGLPRVFIMSSRDGTGKRKLTTLPASHPTWPRTARDWFSSSRAAEQTPAALRRPVPTGRRSGGSRPLRTPSRLGPPTATESPSPAARRALASGGS